jgi:ribosome-associated protein
MNIFSIPFEHEIYFSASRSSGSGGQNVNKVSTKVELNFDVKNSKLLTKEQKHIIFSRQKERINKNGVLKIVVQETRSQTMNKEIALRKFFSLIEDCFRKVKKRIPTRASKSSNEKRLREKKKHSELKKERSQRWL